MNHYGLTEVALNLLPLRRRVLDYTSERAAAAAWNDRSLSLLLLGSTSTSLLPFDDRSNSLRTPSLASLPHLVLLANTPFCPSLSSALLLPPPPSARP